MKLEKQTPVRRRQFVRAIGASGLVTMAGCLSGENGEGTPAGDETDGDAPGPDTWQTATLLDTTTGTEFQIAEFDEPTLVHTFASNCLTCANQQAEFVTLWDRRDDIEIVELSVDPNDTQEDIATHADRAGLEWRVGVAPEPVTGSLIEAFGPAVSVSAQSPIIIRCPAGTIETVSKIASPDELEGAIEDTC